MGDRGNICMVEQDGSKIFFYTHWNGSNMLNILRNAMIRGKDRWSDEPYLARIIFSEMIKDNIMDTTGYGISTYLADNENDILYVDVREQKITTGSGVFTFEQFVN